MNANRFACLTWLCLCFGLGCSSSGDDEQDGTANGSGGAAVAGTGGASATGAGGAATSAMTGSGGVTGASGSGGGSASGGSGGSVSGGMSGSGGAGASGAGGSSGSGGAAPDAGPAPGDYNPCPQNGDPCKILPLGDSITFGIQLAGAYRIELFKNAVLADQNVTFVGSKMNGPDRVEGVTFPKNHEGYSGYTIDQIDEMILTPALKFEPDIITLMIGTNDMYGRDPAGAPDRLSHLLDDIFSMDSHALLVLAKLTPLSCCEDVVGAYNKALADLVDMHASAGHHIAMVDMSETMISGDSVHPSPDGYAQMGDVWYEAVKDLLPKK
jgi:lysophospholipase L1-like esterase